LPGRNLTPAVWLGPGLGLLAPGAGAGGRATDRRLAVLGHGPGRLEGAVLSRALLLPLGAGKTSTWRFALTQLGELRAGTNTE